MNPEKKKHLYILLLFDSTYSLVVQMVATILPTSPSIGSNLTWDTTLCHPRTVFLCLGILCVCFMYICKIDTEYNPNVEVFFETNKLLLIYIIM